MPTIGRWVRPVIAQIMHVSAAQLYTVIEHAPGDSERRAQGQNGEGQDKVVGYV